MAKLISVLRDEVEFMNRLQSDAKFMNSLVRVYTRMLDVKYDREDLFNFYKDKMHGMVNNINIISNRQIFESVKLLNGTTVDDRTLDVGYIRVREFATKMGAFELELKTSYSSDNIIQAFERVFNAFMLVEEAIVDEIENNAISNQKELKAEHFTSEEVVLLKTKCIKNLEFALEFMLDDEEYNKYTTLQGRYNYIIEEALIDRLESEDLQACLYLVCANYKKSQSLISEEAAHKEAEEADKKAAEAEAEKKRLEEEAAKKAAEQKKAEEEEAESEEQKKTKNIRKFVSEKYSQYISKTLQDIKIAYTALFASGYGVIEPDGLICDGPEGGAFLHFEKGNYKHAVYESPAYMNDIYMVLSEALGLKQSNSRKITFKQINAGYNYYPMKLLEYTFGRYTSSDEDIDAMIYKKHASSAKWSDYFKEVIEKPLKENCESIIVDYVENQISNGIDISKKDDIINLSRVIQQDLLNKIYRAHVPCLIMSELSDGRMKIRVSDIDRKLTPSIMKGIEDKLLNIIGSKEIARIDRANSVERTDGLIKEFEVVKDSKLCGALPLFAYTALDKLIEQGSTPSWDNLVLGRAEDDSIYIANNPSGGNKLNFKSETVIHISAGSRSGKGVMTLNILASGIASGIPVFYLDSKPDMASLLKYMAGGKIFAVQGGEYAPGADMGGVFKDDTRNRLIMPDCVKSLGSAELKTDMNGWSALQYFKALDFCIWLMTKIGKKTIPNITTDDRMIVVADEMWRFQGSFMAFIDRFKDLIPTESQKTKGTANELALYADKLTKWQIGNVNSWKAAKNATLKGTAPVLITIYQELEPSTSKTKFEAATKEGTILGNGSVYRGLMDVGSAGLVGYSGNEAKAHSLSKTPKGAKYMTYANRYFAYVPNIENQVESTAEFFKPFLILNDTENENDSQSYVGQLKGQLQSNGLDPDEVLAKYRDENGVLNPAIGFQGYIEKMGGDAIKTLQKSYELANAVLEKMGYFKASGKSDVLDYLYDFRPEFLLSWGEMDAALERGSITADDSESFEVSDIPDRDFGSANNSSTNLNSPLIVNDSSETPNNTQNNGEEPKKPSFFDSYTGGNTPEPSIDPSNNGFDQLSDELTNLIKDIDSRSQEEPVIPEDADEAIKEQYKKLFEEQQKNAEITKKLADVARVFAAQSQANPSFSFDSNGQPVFKDNAYSKRYGEEVSFKNSLQTTFQIGKKSLSRKFLSWRGIEKESSGIFKELLDSLEYEGIDFRAVSKVMISTNELYINKRLMNLQGTCLDPSQMDLVDIVDFRILFKRMKNISHLALDCDAMDKLYQQECSGTSADYTAAIIKLFGDHPDLIELRYIDYKGNENVLRRDMLSDPSVQSKIQQMQESGILTSKLKLASFNGLGGVKNSAKLTSKARGAVKTLTANGMKSSIPKTMLGIGVAAQGLAAAGAIFGAPIVLIGLAGLGVHKIAKLGEAGEENSSKKKAKS